MIWIWNGWALLHFASAAVTLSMAALVWATARGRLTNKALALLLFAWFLFLGTRGLSMSMGNPGDSFAWVSAMFATWPATAFLMLLFLGTLPSRLARPLASPAARWTLAGASLVSLPVWVFVLREKALTGVYQGAFFARWMSITPGDLNGIILFDFLSLATGFLGLLVAFDLVRRSPAGTESRRRAKFYLLAFGAFEGGSIALFGVIAWMWNGGDWAKWISIVNKPEAANVGEAVVRVMMAGGWAVNLIVFALLLGYALLRTQLFDIDLKIKWGLRRGTLVGAFLAAFFVASAMAQQFLEGYGVVAGGAAIGVMLLALRPLERAADRLADHAMPRVKDTAEYRTVRKREVYRAAFESALEDGADISTKERGMLATLAEHLAIGPKAMHDIEQEVRATHAGMVA